MAGKAEAVRAPSIKTIQGMHYGEDGQAGESDTASVKWREAGDSWGGAVQRCSRRGAGAGVLTAPCPQSPGIDKLTEKSQVSEDGTLRSLESAPQQSSAEDSPATEVGPGELRAGGEAGRFPFLLGPVFLPGESHKQRNLAGYSLWGP